MPSFEIAKTADSSSLALLGMTKRDGGMLDKILADRKGLPKSQRELPVCWEERIPTRMLLKAIAFDWGHTLMDEHRDEHIPLDIRPVHLMPGVADVLPQLTLPLALWANTRVAREKAVRAWLDRAGFGPLFQWVVTSVDAGARKPAPEFFEYALARCGLTKGDVLFVGNQLNSDIAGGEAFGIRTVWLGSATYHSLDDGPCTARATYTIDTLHGLPALVQRLAAC